MTVIRVKQKEAKTLRFTCTASGAAVDLSAATLAFMVKASKGDADGSAKISKLDSAFGKAQSASGIVTLPLSATDLDQVYGNYFGELKITFTSSNIDKSADITLIIEQAVISA